MNTKRFDWSLRLLTALTIIVLITVTVVSPLFTEKSEVTRLSQSLVAPNQEFLFGTDVLGRSILDRVLAGANDTVFSSIIVVALTVCFGTVVGMLSGAIGGRFDTIISRLIDVFLAFPQLVLAIAIVGMLGPGLHHAMFAIGLVHWTKYARLARSQTIQTKNEPYIILAPIHGNSRWQIIRRYYLPNVFAPILVTATIDIGIVMMEIAGLSYIGLGAPVGSAEWGAMINADKSALQYAPWTILFPCLAMVSVVLLFNIYGEKLRQYFS